MSRKGERGVVLGKFMPPHLGHCYLVDFARHYVGHLTVMVGSLEAEPIAGEQRVAWMRELFPEVRVVHIPDENPQVPEEHPDFWDIWRHSMLSRLPEPPDVLFAGEDYGEQLAQVLGARFVPLDRDLGNIPTSGTAIRDAPWSQWRFLPRPVQPFFVGRVCIVGPESTGKSTLARTLAQHFGTVWVPEYARTVLERSGGEVTLEHIETIARGQMASEDALSRQANKLLICDTDLVMTTLWSEALLGTCPSWIEAEAQRRHYDLYLLCDVDVPFVEDTVRYLPRQRERFMERCQSALEARGLPVVTIRGSWQERTERAIEAITDLLETGSTWSQRAPVSRPRVEPYSADAKHDWWSDFYDESYAELALEEGPVEETADFLEQVVGLAPGARIFEQCCGVGRYGLALARRGFSVEGVDAIAAYVDRARERAEEAGVAERVRFEAGDAFEYLPESSVDLVINWSTSFGYTPDDLRNSEMLSRGFEALKPGGAMVLEYHHTPWLLRHFQPTMVHRFARDAGELLVIRESTLALDSGLLQVQWTRLWPDGRRDESRGDTRLYMPHELVRLFRMAGFESIALYGDLSGGALTLDSPRCIVMGRKPAHQR